NAVGRRLGPLGTRHREDALAQVGGDASCIDRNRKLERAAERAVAALDQVVLLTGSNSSLATRPRKRETVVVELDVDVVAREAGEFRRQDIRVRRFEQIDARGPAGLTGGKTVQPLLNRQQVTERVPACKGHEWQSLRHRSTANACATIDRF